MNQTAFFSYSQASWKMKSNKRANNTKQEREREREEEGKKNEEKSIEKW